MRAEQIQAWLIEQLALQTGIPATEIDPTQPFSALGVDSMQAITLAGDLEDWLHCKLSATLVWDYPTIMSLSEHLAERVAGGIR